VIREARTGVSGLVLTLLVLLQVTHVFCDPLQRSQLEQAVDFGQVQAAMVLCDEWCDPGGERAVHCRTCV
jgi:hypothetical protein